MVDIFIIGCGYVGSLVAQEWGKDTRSIATLVRSEDSAAKLQAQGVLCHRGDLDDPSTLSDLSVSDTLLYYFAPPPPSGETDSRMANFLSTIEGDNPPRHIVYISTSGVYGDRQGEWVDETTPIQPQASRAKRRADAESKLQSWCQQRQCKLTILRVAGIYGPHKLPIARLKKGTPVLREEESGYTNRIHVSDLVDICIAAPRQQGKFEIYNVCDGHPGTMTQYFNAVADKLELPRPEAISMAAAKEQLTPAMLSYLTESRRIDNRKLLKFLGRELHYPTLESGLAAINSIDAAH